jgi:hypothetical protein
MVLTFIVGLVVAIPVIVALLIQQPVTFNVVAQTEQLSVTFSQRGVIVWSLDGIDVSYVGQNGEPLILTGFSGSFQPARGSRATFVRRSLGPLELTIEAPVGGGGSAGVLRGADDQPLPMPKQSRLTLISRNVKTNAELGNTIYWPIEGLPELGSAGAVPSISNAPILRSANVSLLGRSPFSRDRFNGGVFQLDTGDRFEVLEPEGIGQGFVFANETPALGTVFRIVGASGKVTRFGGAGYDISVSVWQLLSNDPLVRTAWIVIGSVAAFVQLVWSTDRKASQNGKSTSPEMPPFVS